MGNTSRILCVVLKPQLSVTSTHRSFPTCNQHGLTYECPSERSITILSAQCPPQHPNLSDKSVQRSVYRQIQTGPGCSSLPGPLPLPLPLPLPPTQSNVAEFRLVCNRMISVLEPHIIIDITKLRLSRSMLANSAAHGNLSHTRISVTCPGCPSKDLCDRSPTGCLT